jgi:hypothetical protein
MRGSFSNPGSFYDQILVAAENGLNRSPELSFQTVKTVTSTSLGPRFELQLCTEQLLGVYTVISCILQPWFENEPCAELLKTVHTLTSHMRSHVFEKSVLIRRST